MSTLPPDVRTMTLERAQDVLKNEPEHPHRDVVEALYSAALAASDCPLVEGWLQAKRPYMEATR